MKNMRENILRAVEENTKREARYPLSPSQATKSLRDLYYSLLNYNKKGTIPEDKLDGSVLLRFELGHLVESHILKYVEKAYKVKDIQAYVAIYEGDFAITGNIDWAIEVDGETILMDSKSSGSYPFRYKLPKEENIVQMQLYMHSDWGRKNNVSRAILLYYNKDNSDLKCIEVKYDPIVAIHYLRRLASVRDMHASGVVPPREYVLGVDWQASYSVFKTYDNKEFEAPESKREIVKGSQLTIRDHVLAYGNKIVDINGKQVYAKKQGDKLILITKGERVWEEI